MLTLVPLWISIQSSCIIPYTYIINEIDSTSADPVEVGWSSMINVQYARLL